MHPRNLHRAAVALRVALAVLGTGYVHPDEQFQAVEVGARDVLGVAAHVPWEFGGNGTTGRLLDAADFPPFV